MAEQSEWARLPSAKDRFLGRNRKKVLALFVRALLGEEPEKQRPAVPQDAGETRMCARVNGEHLLLEFHRRVRSGN
jgi:hypothetical protein